MQMVRFMRAFVAFCEVEEEVEKGVVEGWERESGKMGEGWMEGGWKEDRGRMEGGWREDRWRIEGG